jgi:D-alanine-D-alanine ligase
VTVSPPQAHDTALGMATLAPMRILVLHSDIAPDAPPDEQDTLRQAAAIEAALQALGHYAASASFAPDPKQVGARIREAQPDLVFNLVESVWGKGLYAPLGPQMLASMGLRFTGAPAGTIAATSDKLLAKRLLAGAGLPTASWSEGPDWADLAKDQRWIVKSADEDASLGLDDDAVVTGGLAVLARVATCNARYGGRWFAEAYIEGREFNVAMLERDGEPFVLPIGEMIFERWDEARPRIVGYAAKWDDTASEYHDTLRIFGWETREPELNHALENLAKSCWHLFGCRGYARVDFRVDGAGQPVILDVNANPCLEPDAGFAAAAAQAGLSYGALIDHVIRAAS